MAQFIENRAALVDGILCFGELVANLLIVIHTIGLSPTEGLV